MDSTQIINNTSFFALNIETLTLLLTLLSTLAWLIYVYYTIRTFKEIKKQTDLQSRSYLIVNTKESEIEPYVVDIIPVASDLHEKWYSIINNNYAQGIREVKVLILRLLNRGKSDIIHWELKITGRIKAGAYLKNKINIGDEDFRLNICSTTNQQIAPNEDIEIPILPIGLFPLLELEWEISYRDILTNETYELKSNGFEYKNSNLIVFNAK